METTKCLKYFFDLFVIQTIIIVNEIFLETGVALYLLVQTNRFKLCGQRSRSKSQSTNSKHGMNQNSNKLMLQKIVTTVNQAIRQNQDNSHRFKCLPWQTNKTNELQVERAVQYRLL